MDNRRTWLKKIGLGTLALGVGPYTAMAQPMVRDYTSRLDNKTIPLNANENPYGPSPLARIAMADSVNLSNRYGWSMSSKLVNAIAGKNEVAANNVLLDAGSTKILNLILLHTAQEKGSFIMADNTFNFWISPAKNLGLKEINVPLTSDKKHDLNAMLKAIEPDTRMLYLCNPNNPTGTVCNRNELVSFVNEASKKVLVVVDEAYIDLTDQQSLSPLVTKNENLIIVRTFSKMYGLAGARVGYALAHKATIKKLKSLQSWPNGSLSLVSKAGALASLKDVEFSKKVYALNEAARKYTIEQLEQLNISCIPSHSNFLYFSLADYQKDYFEQLEEHDILGTRIYEENGQWSRITIGTMDEMKALITALS